MEKYMTVSEAADLLQVSERTILRYIAEGKLSAFKVGRAYRFTQKQIEAYIESMTV